MTGDDAEETLLTVDAPPAALYVDQAPSAKCPHYPGGGQGTLGQQGTLGGPPLASHVTAKYDDLSEQSDRT